MRRQSVFVRFCIIWPEESLGKGGSRFCQLPGGSIRSANVMIPKNISGSGWRETFFSFNGFSYKPESLTFPRIGPAFFLDWGALLRWKLNEKKISMCTVLRFLENCSQTVSKHKSLCFQAFNLKKKKLAWEWIWTQKVRWCDLQHLRAEERASLFSWEWNWTQKEKKKPCE